MKVTRQQLDRPTTLKEAKEFKFAKELLKNTEGTIDILKEADNMDKVDLNMDRGTVVIDEPYSTKKKMDTTFGQIVLAGSMQYDPVTGDVKKLHGESCYGNIEMEHKNGLFGSRDVIRIENNYEKGKLTIDKNGMISIKYKSPDTKE